MIRDTKGRFLGSLARVRPELRAAEMTRRLMIRRTRHERLDRFGRPLAPLKDSTIAQKLREGKPTNLGLTHSGDMLDRLQVRRGRRAAGQGNTYGAGALQSAEVVPGTRRDEMLFRIHAAGSARRNLAQRDAWGLTSQEERLVMGTFREAAIQVEREMPRDRRRRIKIKFFGG